MLYFLRDLQVSATNSYLQIQCGSTPLFQIPCATGKWQVFVQKLHCQKNKNLARAITFRQKGINVLTRKWKEYKQELCTSSLLHVWISADPKQCVKTQLVSGRIHISVIVSKNQVVAVRFLAYRHLIRTQFSCLLDYLIDYYTVMKDTFRRKAYTEAQQNIMAYPMDVTSSEQIRQIVGVGKGIGDLFDDFLKYGTLKILSELQKNLKSQTILQTVHGVGPKTAQNLMDGGVKSIRQLKKQVDTTNLVLKHHRDLQTPLSRVEATRFLQLFRKMFLQQIPPKCTFKLVPAGEYRRGLAEMKKVDIILVGIAPEHFNTFLKTLDDYGIVVGVLAHGLQKCTILARLGRRNKTRKINFLFTSPTKLPFALLYFTGSREFVIKQRSVARKMGFTLNETGLFHNGQNLICKSEKAIFDKLGMVYKEPKNRNTASDVIDQSMKRKKHAVII